MRETYPKPTRTVRVPMADKATGARVWWTVLRYGDCRPASWGYVDADGYERHGGETWAELVDRFSLTAENYGLTHRLS